VAVGKTGDDDPPGVKDRQIKREEGPTRDRTEKGRSGQYQDQDQDQDQEQRNASTAEQVQHSSAQVEVEVNHTRVTKSRRSGKHIGR
jgi:hypothetical protein